MQRTSVLVLASLIFAGVANSQPLPADFPKNWHGHISGIEVNTNDLGEYKGISQIEGGNFYLFSKQFTDVDGEKFKCDYYIFTKENHYVVHFCNQIMLKKPVSDPRWRQIKSSVTVITTEHKQQKEK